MQSTACNTRPTAWEFTECPPRTSTISTSASPVQPITQVGEAHMATVNTRARSMPTWGRPIGQPDKGKPKSFGRQRRARPLCDDFPEFCRKLVAVESQPLIKRALRPFSRLLSRLLVLRGFALVLL